MWAQLHESEGGLDIRGILFGDDLIWREEGGDRQKDLVIAVFAFAV
jgi:hypothetical protein